jgi:hypothetical protein
MHIYLRRIFIYILAAWLLLGVTFLFPQPLPSTQLQEGVEITARGLPLPFYASGTSVFTGPIPAQVSIGFLLIDFFIWFIIIVVVHFLYKNLVRR